MKKFILGLALVSVLGVLGGCASGTINTISDEGLALMDPSSRASYRVNLDKADSILDKTDAALDQAKLVIEKSKEGVAKAKETVGQAKGAYDSKYNPDGTLIVPEPEPTPEPEPEPVE